VLLATHNHGVLHRFDRVMDMAHFARPSAVGGSSGEGGNPTP
jgi:hypothetical protein